MVAARRPLDHDARVAAATTFEPEGDGRRRVRYHGSGHRAPPTRFTRDTSDMRAAITELQAALELMESAEHGDFSREDRREMVRTARGKVELAGRFVDLVVLRPEPKL